jgi:DNA-binding GntR family transcriptional regulator
MQTFKINSSEFTSRIENANLSRAESAYAILQNAILKGLLNPGQKLDFETLQTEMGYSSGTIREALTQLKSDGLVQNEVRRGFTVAEVSLKEFSEITELRCILEPLALTKSIEAGGDDWESTLVLAHHKLTKLEKKSSGAIGLPSIEWPSAHKKFHEALVNSCPSKNLLVMRESLFKQSERYRFLASSMSSKKRNPIKEHKDLFEAAIDRNTQLASTLITEHLNLTAKNLHEILLDKRLAL